MCGYLYFSKGGGSGMGKGEYKFLFFDDLFFEKGKGDCSKLLIQTVKLNYFSKERVGGQEVYG